LSAERFPGPARTRTGEAPARLTIRLPRPLFEAMVEHCRASLPIEACGLLLGRRDGDVAEITDALPAPNILASPNRYEIEPEAVLAADRQARATGQLLLGAWHSHPAGPAEPSATDQAEAWPDWCYLIAGFAGVDAPRLRAWRLVGEHFVEDLLELE
jgi:desampylase